MKATLIVLFAAVMLQSCSNCEVCSYTNDRGDQIQAEESCGSKKKREDFRNMLQDQWGVFGEVECVEN